MMLPPLLDFSEPSERAEIEMRLSGIVDPSNVFGWCARPQLYPLVRVGRSPVPSFDGAIDWTRKLHHDSTTTVRSGNLVAIADTENQRRVVRPVVTAHSERSGVRPADERPRSDPDGARELLRASTEWMSSTLAQARASHVELDRRNLHHLALVIARTLARARSLLAPGDVLLVANQHVPIHRAWLWVAAELGCPTVYVPHAPVARNRSYADLPTTVAAVRSHAELDAYAAAGADTARLVAGGNPGFVDADRRGPTVPRPPLILAPPLDHDEAVALHGLLCEVDRAPVVVAPHPAADRRALARILPDSWSIVAPGVRTAELLRQGAAALVQCSSGLGWEALHLGVPLIEVAVDDRRPRYLYLDDVPSVRSAADLAAALDAPWAAERCRDHADRWCPRVGTEAATAIAAVIDDAHRWSTTRVALDGWFGGPAGRVPG